MLEKLNELRQYCFFFLKIKNTYVQKFIPPIWAQSLSVYVMLCTVASVVVKDYLCVDVAPVPQMVLFNISSRRRTLRLIFQHLSEHTVTHTDSCKITTSFQSLCWKAFMQLLHAEATRSRMTVLDRKFELLHKSCPGPKSYLVPDKLIQTRNVFWEILPNYCLRLKAPLYEKMQTGKLVIQWIRESAEGNSVSQ